MPATATRNGLLSAAHVAPPLMEMSMAPDEASFLHDEEPAPTVTTTLSETRDWGFGLPSQTPSALKWSVSTGTTWACGAGSGRKASGSGEFRIFDPQGVPLTASAYGWTRLFQGREYIPMLDAYDFRARTLWPELGRFGQEDPAGTVDSTNRYQALGGRWNGVMDPLGLYEEDVHHYLTTFLARAAGFPKDVAEKLGWEAQELDMDARSAMHGGANQGNMESFHMVTEERLNAMGETAMRIAGWTFMAGDPGRWSSAGEYLHALEDSYSHQSNEDRRDFSQTYGTRYGHALKLHEPDWTWKREGLAHSMAMETYQKLKKLCVQYMKGCEASPGYRTWVWPSSWTKASRFGKRV